MNYNHFPITLQTWEGNVTLPNVIDEGHGGTDTLPKSIDVVTGHSRIENLGIPSSHIAFPVGGEDVAGPKDGKDQRPLKFWNVLASCCILGRQFGALICVQWIRL